MKASTNFTKKQSRYDDLPSSQRRGKYVFIYSMISLQIIGFFVFYVGVNLQGILLAFQQPTGIVDGKETFYWTFRQFQLFWEQITRVGGSSTMQIAFRNTFLYFGLDVLIIFPINFCVAYMLNKKLPGHNFLRVSIFLPSIISAVAITIMFKTIIAPDGPLAYMLHNVFGKQIPPLLTQDSTATPTLMFYEFFVNISASVLLLSGSFSRIPSEIEDSARIDGVNEFQKIFHIDIPLIRGTLATLLVLKASGLFGASGPILLMTQGRYNTTTFGYWVYDMVKLQDRYNLPAATGIVLTLISIPVVFGARKLLLPKEETTY